MRTADAKDEMYRLRCAACGAEYADDGLRTRCESDHEPAFLRTVYAYERFEPDERFSGMLRYHRWLPGTARRADTCPRPAILQSAALNRRLGTPNLWLAFNGYWPERGAAMPTATFKDLESAAVIARFPAERRILVAASAGNTAAALASAASAAGVRAVIVVPSNALSKLRFRAPLAACVRIIAIPGESSYDDAITFAREFAGAGARYAFEGGAANVARRDGIATTMLSAAETLGALPDVFVQAIGSGAGAIAAHEAALRLRADGRFGYALPKLLLVQNAPSAPVHESWQRASRNLISYGDDAAQTRARIARLSAPVLSTQTPPYAVRGGLFDVLSESRGDTVAIENADAAAASALFTGLEGVPLEPAAAVALAGLISAIESRAIARDDRIVLHITGGGRIPDAVYGPSFVEPAA